MEVREELQAAIHVELSASSPERPGKTGMLQSTGSQRVGHSERLNNNNMPITVITAIIFSFLFHTNSEVATVTLFPWRAN